MHTTDDCALEMSAVPPPEERLKENFGLWSCMSAGFNTLNLFGGLSYIFVVGFSAGGFPAIIYGFIGSSVGAMCIMATFAECASHYPTPGGAYHYASFLTPAKHRRWLSYPLGWFNYLGWVLTYAACCSIMAGLTWGLANLVHSDFDVSKRWQLFLLYELYATIAWFLNLVSMKAIPKLELVGLWMSMAAFGGFTIALLAAAPKAPAKSVFVTIQNATGYSSDAMAVVIGLFNSMAALLCLDCPSHLAEELKSPTRVLPKIIYGIIGSQFVVGLVWMIVLGFSATDYDAILLTSTGVPILELIRLATSSNAAAIVFSVALLVNYFIATITCCTTASRQGLALARDGGMLFRKRMTHVHTKLEVPVWSVHLCFILTAFLGLVFWFSTQGFSALLGAETFFMLASYGAPAAIMLWTRRSLVPPGGKWDLGKLAYPICGFATFYMVCVLALVVIPQQYPLTATNMNYTSLIVGVFSILILASWLLGAKKHYKPPSYEDFFCTRVDAVSLSTTVTRDHPVMEKRDTNLSVSHRTKHGAE